MKGKLRTPAHGRCRANKENCLSCKGAHRCKTCAPGYELEGVSGGSCVYR